MEHTLTVAPNSTYKIYDALFGLEEKFTYTGKFVHCMEWRNLSIEARWNADQTSQSAVNFSVNWYFESVDEQLGAIISTILRKLGMETKI